MKQNASYKHLLKSSNYAQSFGFLAQQSRCFTLSLSLGVNEVPETIQSMKSILTI